MSFTSKGTAEIIVAGLQDKMLVIDLIKGEVVKQVSLPVPTNSTTAADALSLGSNGTSVFYYEARPVHMRCYKKWISTPSGSHQLRCGQDMECPLSIN